MIALETLADKVRVALDQIGHLSQELIAFCQESAAVGRRQFEVEQGLWQRVLEIGKQGMDLYLGSLGDGDLGESLTTAEGTSLVRSEEPHLRPLRTVFGEHEITAYVYAAGSKQKIALRPIDAQIELPDGVASYFYEEVSQLFCVDQAFGTGSRQLENLLRHKASVDSLERINRRLGEQADVFLNDLPLPPASEEGELLVMTGDGKGVPLIKQDAEKIPVFDQRERPGNRRMATLGGVYSVDRYVRTAEDILNALFREEPETQKPKRPPPQFKELVGNFSHTVEDGDEEILISGTMASLAWAAERVKARHRPDQPIVVLMDGQPSLWDTAAFCLEQVSVRDPVQILDVIHVASYVWRAAKVFESSREHQEAFAWTRLKRLLEGDVAGVIFGLRQMAGKRKLKGRSRTAIEEVCRYFENNRERMRYDDYLEAGYPIATGVIEGACRHVVKDRMERGGMRWALEGAEAMLNVRCVFASAHWETFQQQRMKTEQAQLHPLAKLAHSKPIKT
jgi:hypothetical protein